MNLIANIPLCHVVFLAVASVVEPRQLVLNFFFVFLKSSVDMFKRFHLLLRIRQRLQVGDFRIVCSNNVVQRLDFVFEEFLFPIQEIVNWARRGYTPFETRE